MTQRSALLKLELIPISNMPPRPRRIGLLTHGFLGWGGGIDFLRIVASSLRAADAELELHVLVPSRGPLIHLRKLRDWLREKLGMSVPERIDFFHLENALSGVNAIFHHIDLGAYAVAFAAWRLGLDGLLPAIRPNMAPGVPWVGYIFDFQHKHLPHFFTEHERKLRDQAFEQMLESADAVIVNALDVVKDIETFHPAKRAGVFAMPFCPVLSRDAVAAAPSEVAIKYKITSPFFIICNQFWKHKDHGTAFDAFGQIADQHPELLLVCTGKTEDYRYPDYYGQLMDRARKFGISDRIISLGLIPKADQLALLRGSIALIQPTLFEGGPGGGAVYDSVAVGKRSIVSDIPVNMELDDPSVTFFKAGDAGSLASALQAAIAIYDGSTDVLDFETLYARGIERQRICGALLLTAVEHAIRMRRKM